jgi:biopolymer transport protein ExbD
MTRKSRLGPIEGISEINLTPLMDLTFILLITFIITFPLIEQSIPIDLPKNDGDPPPPDQEMIRTISVDKESKFYVNELEFTRAELENEIKMLGATEPDVTIYLRADEALRYGVVMDVMGLIRDARINRIALVTQAETQ